MYRRFSRIPTAGFRALQIWHILVSAATNRQTLTYKQLSDLIGYAKGAGVLANQLGHVAFYCKQNRLPTLTCLVVNMNTGVPGDGIPERPDAVLRERQRVFNFGFQWFDVVPPSPQELKDAAERGRAEYH